jgi:Kef-type K+ transport system membrane component KefB
MIVALIGLNKGLIGQDIYVTLVLMSLLTTMVAPIFLKRTIGIRKSRNERVVLNVLKTD